MVGLRQFLRKKIVNNKFIYLDLWSIIHFFGGFFISLFTNNYFWALSLIIGFEIWEQSKFNGGFFRKEFFLDTFWDVIIGLAGFYVGLIL